MTRTRAARLDDVIYVLMALRPTGAVLIREEHVLANAYTISARVGELRRYVRDTRGWTPTFTLHRATRQPDGSRDYVDITDLWRVSAM